MAEPERASRDAKLGPAPTYWEYVDSQRSSRYNSSQDAASGGQDGDDEGGAAADNWYDYVKGTRNGDEDS